MTATPLAPVPLSGRQFSLENAGARAEIGSLAAVLRSLSVDGVQLTEPVGTDVIAPMGCGIVLAPWPNRVRDGRLEPRRRARSNSTSPSRRTATRSTACCATPGTGCSRRAPSSVTLGALIAPQHGWPFLLDTSVRYELEPDGLTVTHGVQNLSTRRGSLGGGRASVLPGRRGAGRAAERHAHRRRPAGAR